MKDPPFLMGKSTISMAIFNSYVKLPEGIHCHAKDIQCSIVVHCHNVLRMNTYDYSMFKQ